MSMAGEAHGLTERTRRIEQVDLLNRQGFQFRVFREEAWFYKDGENRIEVHSARTGRRQSQSQESA